MSCRTLIIIGLLALNTALFAAASKNIALQKTKLKLMSQLVINLPLANDGSLFVPPDELEDIITCMKPFATLIHQAKSAEQCELIQHKLNLTKALIRNRMILISNLVFEDDGSRKILYHETIPHILALKELFSPHDTKVNILSL